MARPRPKASKAPLEDNVQALTGSGLNDAEARMATQTLQRFAIGAAMQEQSDVGAGNVAGTGDEGFEFGLKTFIDGLRVRFSDRTRH